MATYDEASLTCFLRDGAGYGLRCMNWDDFRRVVESSEASRKDFADIIRERLAQLEVVEAFSSQHRACNESVHPTVAHRAASASPLFEIAIVFVCLNHELLLL